MKLSREFLILILILLSNARESFSNKVISRAISEIIKSEKLSIFEIVLVGGKTSENNLIINEIARNNSEVTFVISVIDVGQKITWKLSRIILLLFSNIDVLKNFLTGFYPGGTIVLVYYQRLTYEEVHNLKINVKAWALRFNFLLDEREKITFATFYLFTPKKCRALQLIATNEFEKSEKKWRSEIFFPEKLSNFHGCQVALLLPQVRPFVYFELFDDGSFAAHGSDFEIMKAVSKALNFAIAVNFQCESCPGGSLYPGSVDMVVSSIALSYNAQHGFTICHPHMFFEVFVQVPFGEPYSGLEKLLLPFQHTVWFWIAATFSAAFVTIFIISKFANETVQKFVFGRDVKTPSLNILIAFFGQAQNILPGRNFARYLLMLFILFNLIIRSAYQGQMVNFFQSDHRKPGLQTIAEALDKNFTFHIDPAVYKMLKGSEILER